MTRIVDLFKTATLNDMLDAGFAAFADPETGDIIVTDSHEHALTQMDGGWFLRLLDPTPAREAWLRGLCWADAPRQVWA